jgi:hypothetical protein
MHLCVYTFRRNITHRLILQHSYKHFLYLDNGNKKFRRNISNHVPNYTVPHPNIALSSFIPEASNFPFSSQVGHVVVSPYVMTT